MAGSKAPRSRNRKTSPWTPLTALAAVIMALVGTMIGTGHRTPQLGIDLAGGTTMVMTAHGNKAPAASDMDTALQIMRNRVNGQGVSEAEVTKQGNNAIEVDLPGKNSSELLAELGQTAKLYFRTVVPDVTQYGIPQRQSVTPNTPQASTPSPSPSGTSGAPSGSSSSKPSSSATSPATKSSGSESKPSTPSSPSGTSTSTQHRVADSGLKDSTSGSGNTPTTPSGSATATASSKSAASTPSTPATPSSPAPSAPSSSAPSVATTAPDGSVKQTQPDAATLNLYETIDCTKPPSNLGNMFAANQYAVGCDFTAKVPYLLEPADVDGKNLSSASANPVTAGGANQFLTGAWQVNLSFDKKGTADFGRVTTALERRRRPVRRRPGRRRLQRGHRAAADHRRQRADHRQLHPEDAENLADVLKYGALPITFDQGKVSHDLATLGGHELARPARRRDRPGAGLPVR